MPFLCVFEKKNITGAAVDNTRLAQLLCPYRGSVESITLPNGQLYLSSIAARLDADPSATGCCPAIYVIPKNTRKNPQTAWLEITVDAEYIKFETDPLGTFPLWCYEDDNRLVLTSEVKSLMALAEKIDISFDEQKLLGSPKRSADFSPYLNIKRIKPGAVVSIVASTADSKSRGFELTEQVRLPLNYTPTSMFDSVEECKKNLTSALLDSAQSIGTA